MALSIRRVQATVGAFVILVVAIFGVWLVRGGATQIFTPKLKLTCYLPETKGFSPSTPVTYLGKRIGRVQSVELSQEAPDPAFPVEVRFWIDASYEVFIRQDFVVTFESDPLGGVLSNKLILQVHPERGSRAGQIRPDSTLVYFEEIPLPDQIKKIVEQVAMDVLPVVETVGAAVEELISASAGLLTELSDPTRDLLTTIRGVRRIIDTVQDPDGPVLGTLASLGRISQTVEDSNGVVGALLKDESIPRDVKLVLTTVHELLTHVDLITAEIAKSSPELVAAGTSTLKHVDHLLEQSAPIPAQVSSILGDAKKMSEPLSEQTHTLEKLLALARRDAELAQDLLAALKRHWLISPYVQTKISENPSLTSPVIDRGEDGP